MLDILVIGGGQAGLALGYHLQQTRYRFQIVEGGNRVGDSWRKRYDSLVLFSSRAYSALPGLAVPGEPGGYPTKDEIADYLETYTTHFRLPVALNTRIQRLERQDDGFLATTTTGELIASRAIVLATGAFQTQAVPVLAARLGPAVVQLSANTYKNPSQMPRGTVLVVGDGATGRQIAQELAQTRPVLLSTGRPRRVAPQRILGQDLFWWLDRLGVLQASRETTIGQYLMRTDTFPGRNLRLKDLRRVGVDVVARLQEVDGQKVTFADGQTRHVTAVIWATGYREDTGWIAIAEAKDQDGNLRHSRGISPVPNLYLIGRSWQWTRGSALLHGVGTDAAYVTECLRRQLDDLRCVGRAGGDSDGAPIASQRGTPLP